MGKGFMNERMGHLGGIMNWPAQVPLAALVTEFIPELCKISYEKLFRDDAVAMTECTLLVQEYIDLDLIIANLDIYNFEGENMGAKIKFYPDHCPDFDRSDYFIKDESDFEKIKFSGMDKGRFPYLCEFYKKWKEYTGFDVEPWFSSPWTLACNLYGLENLVMDTITDPEFVHELLRRIAVDVHVPMLKALHKEFPQMTKVNFADAFATIPMITVDIAEKFIEPYLKLEMELLKEEGIKIVDTAFFGTALLEGEDRKRFEEFIVRVYDILFIMDPDSQILGVDYIRRRANEMQVPMMTGVEAKFVEFASTDEIIEKVKEYLLKSKNGITPALFAINNVTPHTSVENVLTATWAGRVYGSPNADEKTEFKMREYPTFEEFLKFKLENNVEGYSFEWMKESEYAYLLEK